MLLRRILPDDGIYLYILLEIPSIFLLFSFETSYKCHFCVRKKNRAFLQRSVRTISRKLGEGTQYAHDNKPKHDQFDKSFIIPHRFEFQCCRNRESTEREREIEQGLKRRERN